MIENRQKQEHRKGREKMKWNEVSILKKAEIKRRKNKKDITVRAKDNEERKIRH